MHRHVLIFMCHEAYVRWSASLSATEFARAISSATPFSSCPMVDRDIKELVYNLTPGSLNAGAMLVYQEKSIATDDFVVHDCRNSLLLVERYEGGIEMGSRVLLVNAKFRKQPIQLPQLSNGPFKCLWGYHHFLTSLMYSCSLSWPSPCHFTNNHLRFRVEVPRFILRHWALSPSVNPQSAYRQYFLS
ncbi:hypothetical protein O181_036051 [Austropuccinia psidii MF-1]|uniref:Uncharacterized protein n=1 Tax=Austropuccinia psidii MF-1 TaxID=1389203 RepID=A0A9Q3D3P3_9BASI|nr:hypothetical protein [Austropuccinia psidii MF-1]